MAGIIKVCKTTARCRYFTAYGTSYFRDELDFDGFVAFDTPDYTFYYDPLIKNGYILNDYIVMYSDVEVKNYFLENNRVNRKLLLAFDIKRPKYIYKYPLLTSPEHVSIYPNIDVYTNSYVSVTHPGSRFTSTYSIDVKDVVYHEAPHSGIKTRNVENGMYYHEKRTELRLSTDNGIIDINICNSDPDTIDMLADYLRKY